MSSQERSRLGWKLIFDQGGLGDFVASTAVPRELHRVDPLEPIEIEIPRNKEIFLHNPHLVQRPTNPRIVHVELERDGSQGNIPYSLCRQIGIDPIDTTPEIFLTQKDYKHFSLGGEVPRIAIDTGARGENRRWAHERWCEVARRLMERYHVVEIGSGNLDIDGLPDRGGRIPCGRSYLDRLTVRETAALLSRCALLVSCDSGCSHLAAAVGCPQVVLYSRSMWYSRSYWNTTPVFPNVDCYGYQHCGRRCLNSIGVPCLEKIYPDRVLDTVRLAISRFRGSVRGEIQRPAPGRRRKSRPDFP